jgi:V/A-type H+-transporting ATPase subunit I
LLDEAMSHLGSDGTITLISGFVPASRRASLVRRLEREAQGRYYARFETVEAIAARKTPTHLRNWRIFRPFEMFVKTYGLPGYNDIDPTPFVAISFLAMFGMMFGDVGHGLVLAAIGAALAFLPYRALLAMRDLGRILMMAGLSGTLFGFLFGSVFGVEEDHVLKALWMRPSHPENLTGFLGAALGLGLLILSTGIVLGIVQALRQRDVRKALVGQWSAASLVFFWALLLVVGLQMTGREIPVPPGAVATILAIPLCLIVVGQIVPRFRGHKAGRASGPSSPGGSAAAGAEAEEEEMATILFEPIEVVMNLFTNAVSFLRVAAFGLAHAALTMAVFTVNDMVRVPGASILSLPFEHLFIIVLEGMIVTIQCLRLEYYEFFSKFFVGNGVAYAPLSIRADESIE